MIKLVAAVVFALAASPLALAQDKARDAEKKAPAAAEAKKEPSEKQKAHQARMKECAGRAEGKKGDERKQFMSACLKGENVAAAPQQPPGQQDRMKACNKQAGDKQLKGDERKQFMSACLKG